MSRTPRSHPPNMGPPPDVVMGPPPLPSQVGVFHTAGPAASSKQAKDSQDVAEKYRRLKKRYFELEERHKDAVLELRRSGERTVSWMDEKSALLERIDELTSNELNPDRAIPSPILTAYPRSLLNPRNQREFIRNLDQGILEAENESLDLDPLQMSRHVGPQARRMQEAEEKERQEEEAREARRATKRPRAGTRTKDALPPPMTLPPQQHIPPPHQFVSVPHIPNNHPPPPLSQPQMMVQMPPGPPMHSPGQAPMHSPPIMSSNSGTRQRLKPPTPPSPDEISPAPSSSSSAPHPAVLSVPPPQGRSESPTTPMLVEDEYMRGPSPPPILTSLSAPVSSSSPMPPSMPAHVPAPTSTPQVASPPGVTPIPAPVPASTPAAGPAPSFLSSFPQGTGMVTLSPAAQYRQTPMDPAKAAQSQMQMTLRPSSGTGGPGRPSEMQRHTKPKRLKAHTVTTKSFSIPVVPRDKNHNPMLPLNVGIMTVLNLGTICMREHFHTERYIFPIGYEVTRRYLSTVDPNAEVVYNCKIMDGGDGPKFQIIAADVPESPFTAGTATGAWSVVVRSANMIRNRQHSNSVSGPDFFGLGQNTIKHLIQELSGADMLKDYVWQKFVEGGPLGGRHAAVIPALPEDHETNIMYAPVAPATNGTSSANNSPPAVTTPPIINNGNGAPSHYYTEHGELVELDRPRELQIIHVDTEDLQSGTNHAHDGRVRHRSTHALSQGAPATMTSTIKPIMFHQEYSMPPPAQGQPGQAQAQPQAQGSLMQVMQMHQQQDERVGSATGGRERRNSRTSNASYEEYVANGGAEPVRSPASVGSSHRDRDRPPSRSPLLHRDQQAQATYPPSHPHPPPPSRQGSSSQQHSPYPAHNAVGREGDDRERGYVSPPGTAQAGVPATFASIMNAYPPGSERERSREQEYARQETQNGRSAERRATPEYAYTNGR